MAAGGLRVSSLPCFIQALALWLLLTYGNCYEMQCLEVKKAFTEKGFDGNEVPLRAISGDPLEICPKQQTCCTETMEGKLQSLSKKEHAKQLDEAYKLIRLTFASRTRKFDEFFTELLDNARRDLHEMFVKTYGLLYQQNAQIFTDLFDDLRGYYKGRDKNLKDVMDNFFSRLLQKMFELLNAQYAFDETYMACVTDRMDELKPFGDVPAKLSIQVRRAFIAARTFVQGLAIGRDVIMNVMEVPATDQCTRGLMKMMYCPYCQGLTNTKPCNNFCLNTMKGCLAYQADINSVWNDYIEAMKMLANRLEGPFNIESVVDPIDVKISDAIMNLQENSAQVSAKIFAGCGTPRLGRKKRDAAEKYDYTFNFRPDRPAARPTTAAGTSLDRLVRDIKERVKLAKDFWVQLPYTICNEESTAASPNMENDCWNGQDRAKYIPEVQKDGVTNQINNPEVEVDVTKANTIVTNQIIQLQLITNRLRSAFNGMDVDWIDTDIDSSGSGSGDDTVSSGSGGYMPPPDQEEGTMDIDDHQTSRGGGGKKRKPTHKPPTSPDRPKNPREPTPTGAASILHTVSVFTIGLVLCAQAVVKYFMC